MATKKASDSNLTGKKYNDASAGASKIPDVPDKPTITSVSEVDSTYLRVAFSPSNTGGIPANYVTTASPGGATVTGNSPADFTTLTEGTSYTFTVVPQTSNSISGPTSNSSNSATMPLKLYTLSQTFNTTGNFTVPAGKNSIAIVGTGAGAGGGGSGYRFNAGGGGGGASTAIIENIPTNAGTVYAVTIASAGNGGAGGTNSGSGGNAGGTTTFGNIVTFNGGSGGGGAGGGNNGFEGAFVGTDGGTGANGNNSFNVGSRTAVDNDGGTVTTANAQISSFAGGGAGGSSPYGGTAGSAGSQNYPNPANQGSSGGSGNGPGGGGGASGRRAWFPNEGYIVGGPHSGGNGATGRILVYVK